MDEVWVNHSQPFSIHEAQLKCALVLVEVLITDYMSSGLCNHTVKKLQILKIKGTQLQEIFEFSQLFVVYTESNKLRKLKNLLKLLSFLNF